MREFSTNNQYNAAFLYDGGWRKEDVEELMEEYGYTREEAEEIAKELEEIEERLLEEEEEENE